MDMAIRPTSAKAGTQEYYDHWFFENDRLQEMVIRVPISKRLELAHNIEMVQEKLWGLI